MSLIRVAERSHALTQLYASYYREHFKLSHFVVTQCAVFAGAAGLLLWLKNYGMRSFQQMDFYKEALEILQEHEQAMELLGYPLQFGKPLVANMQNYHSRFRVAVCGANEGGLLDIVASRKTTKDAFTPDRLELRMDGGDRWLIFNKQAYLDAEWKKVKEEMRREESSSERSKQKRPRLSR